MSQGCHHLVLTLVVW